MAGVSRPSTTCRPTSTGKRVLVRVDLNVPMQDGAVSDDTRLRAALPTVAELADKGAIVLLLSHFGRPKGQTRPDMSLRCWSGPVRAARPPGPLHRGLPGTEAERAVTTMLPGDRSASSRTPASIAGEEKNDPELAQGMAALGDFYVNDAFSAAHRAHASTEGRRPSAAGLCRAGDGGRAEGAGEGARQSRAAGRGGGRRGQGLDQARRARAPGRPRSTI